VQGGAARSDAETMLRTVVRLSKDAGLRALARDALDVVEASGQGGTAVRARRGERLEIVQGLAQALLTAPTKDERCAALAAVVELGELTAIPAIRQAFYADPSRGVREEAAHALGELGDTGMVDTFVRMLASRGEDDREAKIAAYALGYLGDVRGLNELLSAYANAYKPAIVADAIRAFGQVALEPLLDLVEERPDLARRAAVLDMLKQMEDAAVTESLMRRLKARAGRDDFAEKAQIYLRLAEAHPTGRRDLAGAIVALLGTPEGDDAQAALRAAQRALGITRHAK
jgi:HEAT repeat protein